MNYIKKKLSSGLRAIANWLDPDGASGGPQPTI